MGETQRAGQIVRKRLRVALAKRSFRSYPACWSTGGACDNVLSLGGEASAPSPPHELIVHTHSHYFYDGSEPSALGGPVFTAATQPVRPTTPRVPTRDRQNVVCSCLRKRA